MLAQVWVFWVSNLWKTRISVRFGPGCPEYRARAYRPKVPVRIPGSHANLIADSEYTQNLGTCRIFMYVQVVLNEIWAPTGFSVRSEWAGCNSWWEYGFCPWTTVYPEDPTRPCILLRLRICNNIRPGYLNPIYCRTLARLGCSPVQLRARGCRRVSDRNDLQARSARGFRTSLIISVTQPPSSHFLCFDTTGHFYCLLLYNREQDNRSIGLYHSRRSRALACAHRGFQRSWSTTSGCTRGRWNCYQALLASTTTRFANNYNCQCTDTDLENISTNCLLMCREFDRLKSWSRCVVCVVFLGTGCTFAAALSSHLAQGHNLGESVALAKSFVFQALSASDKLNVGGGNHGPVNHLWNYAKSWVLSFTKVRFILCL